MTTRIQLWNNSAEEQLGTFNERTFVDIDLPLTTASEVDHLDTTLTVISGTMPPGLYIEDLALRGTGFEVPRETVFRFVVRATNGTNFSDKTFSITLTGADSPEWVTNPGLLPVGNNSTYYILDSTYVDFNLFAIDNDTTTGQELNYDILDSSGELPPGLVLMPNGRIVGFIQPLLAIPVEADSGNYDTNTFDFAAYDFGFRSSNGFDQYVYDYGIYDISLTALLPNKLNRNYEFKVTVTDGDSTAERIFRIYVVGEDHFRADSEVHHVGDGSFLADVSHVKAPIWTTPNYLGIRRADNYHIFNLDIYEDPNEAGLVTYTLNAVNKEIYGEAYTTSSSENKIGYNKVRLRNVTGVPQRDHKLELSKYITDGTFETYNIADVEKVSDSEYILTLGRVTNGVFYPSMLVDNLPNDSIIYFGSGSTLPPGMQFDISTSEIFGFVPYSPAVTSRYSFTVTASRLSDTGEIAYTDRTFTVDIAGEIDGAVTWISDTDLGTIKTESLSTISVVATTDLTDNKLWYTLESGALPNGLSLNVNGDIVGKVNQFNASWHAKNVTTFEEGFTLDKEETTIDRLFTFTVKVRDQQGVVESTKTFTLGIDSSTDRSYSDITVKPFLKPIQRNSFKDFVSDSDVFDTQYIYRNTDPNFGIQRDLSMLVYAGIETAKAVDYVNAISLNHTKKRFKLGDLKVAVAKNPGTNDVVYEVVYINVIDPLEKGSNHLPTSVLAKGTQPDITIDQSNQFYELDEQSVLTPTWKRPDPFLATIDDTGVIVNDSNSKTRYISSISLWRQRIKEMQILTTDDTDRTALTEREYLPLWMRSIQEGSVQELGYVSAIPLCYCIPGAGEQIYLNIKNSNYDFKQLDYTIDRYTINRIEGYQYNKYFVFENNRTTI